MELYANKKQKIKITIYALTGEETLAVSEKHLDKNKVFNLKKAFLKNKIIALNQRILIKKRLII
jgi:hypothetical protein